MTQFKSHPHPLSRLLTLTLTHSKTLNPTTITTKTLLALLLKTHHHLLISNPFPFNSIISSFSRSSSPSLSLQTLSLVHRLALPLDSYSLCSSLSAAAISVLGMPGSSIHAVALKSSHLYNVFVVGALVGFYTKMGRLEDARQVFDEIPVKNVVCVNSLLNGYIERKLWSDGLALFRRMEKLRLEPDEMTLCSAVRICAEAAVIGLGMQAHACVVRRLRFVEKDMFLLSSLVEMYGKCGLVNKARLVFESTKGIGRDVVVWTSMLNAYGRNGMFCDVIRAFEEMLNEKTKPDEIVFLSVISACGHSGNTMKGLKFFEVMKKDYALVPGPEHYGCIVDMLCKVGELEMAWKLVSNVMVEEKSRLGVSVWGAILSACKHSGNVEIGRITASKALNLEPDNVGIYMELSNLYAKVGMWDEIVELRAVMKERGLKKHVGFSWLERTN